MPKKSATTRSAAQRNRPKVQKSFEVVRQTVAEPQPVDDEQAEAVEVNSTPAPVKEVQARKSATKTATRVAVATPEVETIEESDTALAPAPEENGKAAPAPKGSASARLAARRSQKAQQRNPATLITSEHYGYVTRDLIIIAVLASIMFIAIVVLYFTIGRGA